jgi:hypothetical protein
MADSLNVRERLPEMQAAGLPRLDWRKLFTVKEEPPAEDAAALDTYFSQFLPPEFIPATVAGGESPLKCACCGGRLSGFLSGLVGGSFTWGLANGEGYCSACGYPGRAYHRNAGPVEFLSFILQYHPDEISLREEGAA